MVMYKKGTRTNQKQGPIRDKKEAEAQREKEKKPFAVNTKRYNLDHVLKTI